MQMIRHHGHLPKLHLGVEAVHLRQLLLQDSAPQLAKHYMWKSRRRTPGPDVALQMAEAGLATLRAQGDHIQPLAAVGLPAGTTVLAVPYGVGVQPPVLHFFF